MTKRTVIEIMSAEFFKERFCFILSDLQRETLRLAETTKKNVRAELNYLPFGTYLMNLTIEN